MTLHRFSSKKGSTGIQADHLDDNFARLKPLPSDGNASYSIIETPQGWKLAISNQQLIPSDRLLPPPPTSGTFVLGAQNGTITWLQTEACT
jgi:hypothetical protein